MDGNHHDVPVPHPRDDGFDAFAKVFEISDRATIPVEVPFEGTTLLAYYSDASKNGEPVPCVVMWNRLDST